MPAAPRPWLAPLLLALAGACAHADPDRPVLASIDFDGNETFGDGELEEHLALVSTSPWPWADPRYFDAGTLAGDERRLARFYRAQGFYEAKVSSQVVSGEGRARVRLHVTEGPATTVRRLDVQGLAGLPERVRRQVLAPPLPLATGDRITEAAYDATRAELIGRLRERGWGDAGVRGEVRVDVAARAADVSLQVEPGRLLRFGKLSVTGATDVPRSAILEQAGAEIRTGATFRQSALDEARAAVFEMAVFGAVDVRRSATDPRTGTVDVVINVTEAKLHTLRAGGGASFEPRRQEVRAIGEYRDADFLGGLRLLRFENRLGYAFLCPPGSTLFNAATGLGCFAGATEQGLVGASALDLTQPALLGPRIAGNVRVEYERQRDLTYRAADFVRGHLGFPVRLGRHLQLVPAYEVERSFFRSQPVEQEGLICNAPTGGAGCAVTLSRLEESLVWDGRDDPLTTTRGVYASVTLTQGGGILGGDFAYDGALADLRAYRPFGGRMLLALRVIGGVLVPRRGETPITRRFFSGGGSSLRSYGLRAFSPAAYRDGACGDGSGSADDLAAKRACASGDPSTTVPVGGNQLAGASAELRVRVVGDLGVVAFADVASVQAKAFEDLAPSLALGGGLRYATLFGPVRLDAGFRVLGDPPRILGTNVTVDDPPFALHFSIGEAF